MSDDQNSGVILEEAAAPEVIDQQPTEAPIEEQIAAKASEKPKGDKDENIRRMRESMEHLQRQNQELQATLNAMSRPKQQAPQEPVDEVAALAEDDFVNVGQMKKYAQNVTKEAVRQALKEQRGASSEERFRAQNPDYDQVVTKENLETLFNDVPELKPTLVKLYDMALKGEDVDPVAVSYKLIKKFNTNLGETSMNKKTSEVDKLASNSNKPVSSNAIKSSALTQAHKYGLRPTKEEAAKLYKETVEASKGR